MSDPESGPRTRAHIFLSGRVHGVAFRYFVQKWADSLAVTGWVRNLADGRVEVLAEGDEESMDIFLARLAEGPRMARVEGFEVRRERATGEFQGFRIVY
jgi:acylphosphatase